MGSTGYQWGTEFAFTHKSQRPTVKEYLDKQHTSHGGPIVWTILRSCTKGGVYYTAIERVDHITKARDVFALVEPYSFYGKGWDRNLIVKDQDETMGPWDIDCPAAILDLLTEPLSETAAEWRQRCRDHIASQEAKKKSMVNKTVKKGDRIRFKNGLKYNGHGIVHEFEVHSWGRTKRFYAYPEGGGYAFLARISRWALANQEWEVVHA